MRGDKIIIEDHHRRAAEQIAEIILPQISEAADPFIVTIAGESGAGKSVCAVALADRLALDDIASLILQQDDYFVYPPKTNAAVRIKDIGHVGPSEVKLAEMDHNLREIDDGAPSVRKPLVNFDEDAIGEEEVQLEGIEVIIVEGTYTTLLKNADRHIFIDRTRTETAATRIKRAREKQDEYLERILEIEHQIISGHKARADIIITRDYDVKEK